MSVARHLETDSLSNQDIASAAAIGAYTAAADRMIVCDVSLDQVAGNGDYVVYVTRQINGAGSAYVLLPKTTCTAASGETAIAMQSGVVTVRSGDVLTVYVDGLAGDTTTPDTTVRWFEMATLRPDTADRQLTIEATGEASANVTLWNGAAPADLVAGAVEAKLANADHGGSAATIIAKSVTLLNNDFGGRALSIDAGGTGGTAVAITGAFKGMTVSGGTADIEADITGTISGVTSITAQEVRDAMKLAPTAGDPDAGSVDKHLDDILEDTGTTLPGLLAGAGSTAYTNTVTDESANPLDGVEVWITTDSGGASTVASTTTDTLGAFTVYLDPGTYYLWLAKGGYNFGNPTTITVS